MRLIAAVRRIETMIVFGVPNRRFILPEIPERLRVLHKLPMQHVDPMGDPMAMDGTNDYCVFPTFEISQL